MGRKIRVGILGCAQIAKRSLAPTFIKHPSFELIGVASRKPEKAVAFVDDLDISSSVSKPLVYTYDELLESPAELIYCPLPTGLHHEWVLKALKAGKHVLCEKSLGCNYAEVEEMVAMARRQRRFLMESFQFRFHAQNLYVKDLLAKNSIGALRQLVIRFGIPPFPDGVRNIRYQQQLGGGALLDNGAYVIKCATYLLGYDIKVLAAVFGGVDSNLGNVDLTGALMMVSGGVPVQASYGFDHFYQNGYEIWGKEGKISTTRAFTAREDFAAPVILETREGRMVKTFNDDHFTHLMDYLYEAISNGTYENEYNECLIQASLLEAVRCSGGLKWCAK